jgi:hypothetical protein
MSDGMGGYLGRLDIVDDVTTPGTPVTIELGDAMGWENAGGVDTLPATVFGDLGWQDVERGVRKKDLSYTVKVTAAVDTIIKNVLVEGRKVIHHLYRQRTNTTAWIQTYMIQTARDSVTITGLVQYAITATSCHPGSWAAPPSSALMVPAAAEQAERMAAPRDQAPAPAAPENPPAPAPQAQSAAA